MPLCLATLTLLIQEKNLHYLGTNYIFDKIGLMNRFLIKILLYIYHGGSKKITKSLFVNNAGEKYA